MPEAGAHHPASGSGGPATWATDGKHVQELEHVLAHCMHAGMNACNTAPFFIPARGCYPPCMHLKRRGGRRLDHPSATAEHKYPGLVRWESGDPPVVHPLLPPPRLRGRVLPSSRRGVRGTFRWRPSGLWQGCWDVCRHLFGLGFPLRAGWVLGWRLRTGWLLGWPFGWWLRAGLVLGWPFGSLAGFWAGFLPACLLRRSSFGRFTGCSSSYMHACVQKGMHAQARSSMHAQAILRLDCLASASSQIDRLFAGAVDASSANHVC